MPIVYAFLTKKLKFIRKGEDINKYDSYTTGRGEILKYFMGINSEEAPKAFNDNNVASYVKKCMNAYYTTNTFVNKVEGHSNVRHMVIKTDKDIDVDCFHEPLLHFIAGLAFYLRRNYEVFGNKIIDYDANISFSLHEKYITTLKKALQKDDLGEIKITPESLLLTKDIRGLVEGCLLSDNTIIGNDFIMKWRNLIQEYMKKNNIVFSKESVNKN